jgi:hypothetical protein
MRPMQHETTGSNDLFRARLEQIINMKHELVQLVGKIDWAWIDSEIAPLYSDKGRPGIETGLSASSSSSLSPSRLPYHPRHPPQDRRPADLGGGIPMAACAPVAEVRALVREAVLEKLFPGEVLEIRSTKDTAATMRQTHTASSSPARSAACSAPSSGSCDAAQLSSP